MRKGRRLKQLGRVQHAVAHRRREILDEYFVEHWFAMRMRHEAEWFLANNRTDDEDLTAKDELANRRHRRQTPQE